ncbi:MAG TPA: hypothetical protein VFW71_05685 [Actinomycetota bacterium]|nr:hypothetical protein [Actinomycetota bacterium]
MSDTSVDVATDLGAVIDEIRAAKPVPFSTSAMVNRKDLIERLEAVRLNLPKAIRQAQGVVADRQDTIAQTREEAESILRAARAERAQLVARTEIVTAASREADRIIEDAKVRAREIRMEAEDYVDAKLANFEIVLQKTLTAVGRGRESLRGRLEAGTIAALDPNESGELPGVGSDPNRTSPNLRARRR